VILSEPRPVARLSQLGDPSATETPPLPLVRSFVDVPDVSEIATGSRHAVVLDGMHRVWSWGDDANGQLGTGDGPRDNPEQVEIPLEGAAGFVQVAARANQSFALRSDGAVFAWGDNTFGALGLGKTARERAPVRIAALERIVALGAGERHGLALDQDAIVWSWGQNLHGELGRTPSTALERTPAQIPSLYGVTKIAAGGFHSSTIDLVGTLSLWGDGSRGQLGNGGTGSTPAAEDAALPRDVVTVSLGRFHSLAIRSGGSLWSFGDDGACQLGTGTIPGFLTPQPVQLSAPVALIAAGDYHSLAIGYDGTVYGWGDDSRGALGQPGPRFSHVECLPAPADVSSAVMASGGDSFSVLAVAP
jgi:alpha-tubulin suppressor-like RCC1 family protein